MFEQIHTIVGKTRERGFKWLFHRLIKEFRIPETPLGIRLKPINKAFYQFFYFLVSPLRSLQLLQPLNKDTLCLFYDLEVSPITYDLCWALCVADLNRRKLGLKYLQLVIVPGREDGLRAEMIDYESIINKDARRWRIYNLLFPIVHLLPSATGLLNCSSRKEAELIRQRMKSHVYPEKYHTQFPFDHSFIEAAHNSSHDVMALQANKQANKYISQWLEERIQGRKLIVITLREYGYMPKRNSNIQAWVEFAKNINEEKYFVVFIPDTEVAMKQTNPALHNFQLFLEACWNIELRAALYESAYLNLGINNGPFALCWLNKNCRYLMFKLLTEGVPQASEAALEKMGFQIGASPRFATKFQKWVWEDDDANTIQREFNAMCQLIEESA